MPRSDARSDGVRRRRALWALGLVSFAGAARAQNAIPAIDPSARAQLLLEGRELHLQVVVNGKPVTSVPLFPIADVPAGGLWTRLSDTVLLWFQK